MIELNGKYNSAKVFNDNVEAAAIGQIIELCNQKCFEGDKIRIMPDVHAGKDCIVGTTIKLSNKVIPNIVGGDIGCGMLVTKLAKNTEIDFENLDNVIKNYVPHGKDIHTIEHKMTDKINLNELKCANFINKPKAKLSLGTLGGGKLS